MTTTAERLESAPILQTVHQLEPLLREHSLSAEREQRLPDAVARALREAGLYAMWSPRSLGGLELDPITTFRVLEELARMNSAAGWNVQIQTAAQALGAWLPDEGAQEIYNADLILGGTLFPPMELVPVPGGYRATGRSPFVSGCHQCNWFLGPAMLMEGDTPRMVDGVPEMMLAFFPASQAEIIDNWQTLGMRGTGSHDVAITGQFLPTRWTAAFVPLEKPNRYFGGPLYKLKVWGAVVVLAAPAFGIARAAIDDFISLAKQKTPAYTAVPLRERPVVQSQLARAEADLGAARAYAYEALEEAWKSALEGEWITTEQKVKLQLATSHGVLAAARAVDLAFASAGSTSIRNAAPFQKYFRDVHTITQHAFASASRFESAGQLMLGLDTDWPFFAL
jgi:alkylation response protein AidB-like acyl-CoA dehydrogenase